MTTATNLTALVGSDGHRFSGDEKTNAIGAANDFLGTTDGDSSAKDMATAMLAQRILLNSRKSSDKQLSLTDLMTSDIRSLMAEDEKSRSYKIIHTRDPETNWRS